MEIIHARIALVVVAFAAAMFAFGGDAPEACKCAELPAGNVKVETLTGDPKVVNDMANPVRCRPESKSVAFAGGREFKMALPASSLTIIRVKR